MIDKIDDLVDYNLKLIYDSVEKFTYKSYLKNTDNSLLNDPTILVEYMATKRIINIEPKIGERLDLTKKGLEISLKGGWNKFQIDREQKKRTRLYQIIKKQELEDKIQEYQFKLSKWRVKTFW